ncbi:MAG TPA: protein-disulfide reductase DsbD domain-containing protein [Pyrinomonadaceae bacterium]|nr:protein-disulfide reductase DsbD domain-containing protein [Pyrinomonadaceae bacterium]
MKRSVFLAILFVSFCVFASGEAGAQTVTGSIGNGSVERGAKARGNVVMTIPGGLHVNSSRPSSEYAIPTVVSVRGSGVKVTGITYPRGRNRKFQFSENPINVYEGRVNFPFSVAVPAGFKGSVVKVTATVRYQACTDEVCYPPKTKSVTMTARVN